MTYKKKLIEVALPLAAINFESARDKGIRNHPQALHRWWARRPLAAARAVLWASLVDDPSAHPEAFPTEEAQTVERRRLFSILEQLVKWEAALDERTLAAARSEIVKSCDGDLPQILDPFGGGGAIPLEAIRLGLPTLTGDLNPVAVLIQRAMIELPSRFAGRPPVHPDARRSETVWEGARGLGADVEAYGAWVRDEARRRISQYYPDATMADGSSATPIAWIWARTVRSTDPSWPAEVPLVRSWILSKKAGKPVVWVEAVVDSDSKQISYTVREGGSPHDGNVNRQGATCIATGAPMPFSYVRAEAQAGRMGSHLIAIVAEGPSGRVYLSPRDTDAVDVPPSDGPSGAIFDWPGRMNVVRYGMDRWSDLFTQRQMLALTTLGDVVLDSREVIREAAVAAGYLPDGVRLRDGGAGADAYCDVVTTYLSLALSKATDFNCSIASWDSTNVKIRNTFARQAIPMTWDFAEANILGGAVGSWHSMVSGVAGAIRVLPTGVEGSTAQRDARSRVAEAGVSVISTDPPYYDNICYADLSDFFYVWLRRSLAEIWPDEMATLATPKAEELIANQYRAGSKAAAQAHFENGMEEVFREAVKQADSRYPSTVFYAFKATESSHDGTTSTGWETFLSGLLEAGYSITSTWPIRTEKPGRSIAIGSAALASSIVLACRPRELAAVMATRSEFIAALRSELESAVRVLQVENIAPVDLAQSAMGPGIAVFSRYSRVVEADGRPMTVRAALGLINEALSEILSGEESEFDPETRFALTWFEQYGHSPGPFGDADNLARAKNTSVEGVVQSGIISSRQGKVRLSERDDLPDAWDPATDVRLTVWEATQYLIRSLDSSESEAAALLARMGEAYGERARQLAYLLYGICDRKKWAEDAGVYNMLVTAWPELTRLAVAAPPEQGEERLF